MKQFDSCLSGKLLTVIPITQNLGFGVMLGDGISKKSQIKSKPVKFNRGLRMIAQIIGAIDSHFDDSPTKIY